MTSDAETSAGYFAVLQLPPDSSPQQIHAQYRRLAKQYHPDRNPDRREWSEEQLRFLNEAYHALAQANVKPPLVAWPGLPPRPAAQASQTRPPHSARRFLRYLAVVGLVCAISIGYANWSQSPQGSPAGPGTTTAFSNTTFSPAAPGDVADAPAAAPPDTPVVSKDDPALLAARFSADQAGVDTAVAQASRIVGHVNAQLLHAPQSRRPQKAEQLAADMLELSRLQHSLRGGLQALRTPTSPDLHRTQIADLQLALSQLEKQQRVVSSEASSFPTK